MGIQNCPNDDWIQIDNGYLDRLAERRQTILNHPDKTIGVNDVSSLAIQELWTEVIRHVLGRFPNLFRLEGGDVFKNIVSGKTWRLSEVSRDNTKQLLMLSENVEEDFYFMCPDSENEFRLQGYLACFPGGFDSPSRVGLSMAEIHNPVPGYPERIKRGTDRFFSRMKGGTKVQRFNWSLQTDGKDLFRLDGNNFYPEQGHNLPTIQDKIDLEKCYLRCERQSLVSLKKSRAIVFCVRSYMTHLSHIIAEGNGPALADAIESMPEKLGNYKKRPFWEKDIYAYLRA
ncbi:hypothetical protein BGW36DRAFT_357407 [Talaromyces proteolyticus]|uniref:DUF3445 domain-containing protein n=1 Tax=Talaromyces proteolyticus TaxID=1131652 RepID=A0AAD4Q0F6_9EURO|nr:uncharacterized protein BGW36DRAFT_357407 [Talaromyces proteolyticus]KAH8700759.1 hypothetical protein BGW36DRAFT_357407 [Talaromyces proteolyticus]